MKNYRNCRLCPRNCGADRTAGEQGFCRMPDKPIVAKAMIHKGEEPIIMGERGTGAIFFSGCSLRCSFCQNHEISYGAVGVEAKDLRKTIDSLIEQGAESIDLVTPSHYLPHILEALTPKLPVPVVYNCGGYESVESLKQLEGLVDVYLPDLNIPIMKLLCVCPKPQIILKSLLPPFGKCTDRQAHIELKVESCKKG